MAYMAIKDCELKLQEYCAENNLDYDALLDMDSGHGENLIHFYCPLEGDEGQRGLLDETPSKIALRVSKTPDGIVFEQTEHTAKYLKN